jgi:hypothetical protein
VQHSGDTNRRAEYGLYYQYNNTPLRIALICRLVRQFRLSTGRRT